ncbi:MAG: beta-propeller domain-containing protein [Candidatus Aenigmarchaeota archaeon]|nr:beta-propeller domain-containing protein [Candidatus Aenigmarchaeota archaeon]
MNALLPGLVVLLIAAVAVASLLGPSPALPATGVKSFSSAAELAAYLNDSQALGGGFFGGQLGAPTLMALETDGQAAAPKAADFSTTNIQVAGVDEADLVKTDGDYVYTVSSAEKVVITDAVPAAETRIVAEIATGPVSSLYVSGNRLVAIGSGWSSYPIPLIAAEKAFFPYFLPQQATILVYDITDRTAPVLLKNATVEGSVFDSRLVGDDLYVILHAPVERPVSILAGPEAASGLPDQEITLPAMQVDGRPIELAFPVYYFDLYDYGYQYTVVLSLDIQEASDPVASTFLTGYTQYLYVSTDSIYLASQKTLPPGRFVEETLAAVEPLYPADVAARLDEIQASDAPFWEQSIQMSDVLNEHLQSLAPGEQQALQQQVAEATQVVWERLAEETDKIVIQRLALADGRVTPAATGEVPGHPLNQFSMDQSGATFRIATTSGGLWGTDPSVNNLYVLGLDLQIIGSVEGLAEGEQIYAARFLGDRAYLVTFKRVDPLFVIDLSDPANPAVLGELKIPGVSDYLHPYDETHLIGIGRDATDVDEAGQQFALFEGVKISLFDVADVANPKELATVTIGDRGTDSEVLRDHKAFLFSKEKNLLVIPIALAEVKVPGPWAWGEQVSQGAYVFAVSPDDGIVLRGTIAHGNVTDWQSWVKRSLYIGDVLYTVSDQFLKANDLATLEEISTVELPVVPEIVYDPGLVWTQTDTTPTATDPSFPEGEKDQPAAEPNVVVPPEPSGY